MPKRRNKILLILLAVLLSIFTLLYFTVNSALIQNGIASLLASSNETIKIDGLKFNFFLNSIFAEEVKITRTADESELRLNNISVKYNPLGFLKGKFVISSLKIDHLDTTMPKPKTEKRGKISLKKLLLLHGLVVKEGFISDASLKFANGNILASDMLSFQFEPHLTRDVKLKIDLQGANFKTKKGGASLGSLSLTGKTSLSEWTDTPPFVNSVRGEIKLYDLNWNEFFISNLAARVEIKDKKFKLSNFEIIKDSKPVKGAFEIDLAAASYKGSLKIAEPISFPRLGSSNPTIDTTGLVSGELELAGKGFAVSDASGTAKLSFTHAKEDLPLVSLKSSASWGNGVISLSDSQLSIGDGKLEITGKVNVPAQKTEITFDGENIPLNAVFGRFYDPLFHPIFGTAKAKGVFTGWGRNFNVTGEADTTSPGGYYKIVTDHAHAKVVATYNDLSLIGEISQDSKVTGDIDLKIKYGPKQEGSPRPKEIHLDANIINNDLGKSMAEYNLSGTGNGHLVLSGPQKAFTGKLTASIDDGSFAGIAFQKIISGADMTYKKIAFTDGELYLPNIKPVIFSSPIKMDFEEGGFRMFGHPIEEVSFDARFKNSDGSWSIKELIYHNLKASGTYAPKGSNDLSIAGTIDAANLSAFKQFLREADGPLDVKLRMQGPSANPSINGKITFNGNTIYPRNLINYRLENVIGELYFDGHVIRSDYLTGMIEGGAFVAKGNIKHENLLASEFDISFTGDNLRYTRPDRTFRMEFGTTARWRGTRASSLLEGDVTILDGKYTKDFVLLEGLGETSEEKEEGLLGSPSTKINLHINNAGELAIKNNIGEIWLKVDITATGSTARPLISGLIETNEGKIHYLGKDFAITKGFLEFRGAYTNPYMEITAEHEVPTIPDLVITAVLHGRTNNLVLDLSSTKPLERRDIISLLLFGVTEQEVRDAQLSMGLAPSIVASQITHVIERPVTKFAHLDIFRLEAAGQTTSSSSSQPSTQISKIYVGKQLTDRLKFEFRTDINTEDAQQTMLAEYSLTDFLLLKGERSAEQMFKFNISLRFEER
ncbi:MAG: translocation/assembly module TamB domain-containing protein [Deltaproteobacteria bacterium]|nr:translocation/assembly module TamB domain-containing protein [Deltaproteobacteria bacterium]